MVDRPTSRRGFLKHSGVLATGVTLAGCGVDGGTAEDGDDPTQTDADTATATEPPPLAPTVNLQFDYDADAGTVTITHVAGDSVTASTVYVRGEGFADASGADVTAAGQWAGSASGEVDGEPAIVAGDAVSVGVASDYELAVVWEPPEADVTETLAEDSGPGI